MTTSDDRTSLTERLRRLEREDAERRRNGGGYTRRAREDIAESRRGDFSGALSALGPRPVTSPRGPGAAPMGQPGGPALPALPGPLTSLPGQAGMPGPTFGAPPLEDERKIPLVGDWRPFDRRIRPRGFREGVETTSGGAEVTGTDLRQSYRAEPADEVLRRIFKLGKPELAALQSKMFDAGFYGSEKWESVVRGAVDDSTYDAYVNLLNATMRENKMGREVTWGEYLDEIQRLRKEQGTNLLEDGQEKRAPLTIQLTNPADIERVAQDAANELLGREAPPEVVQRIIARYRSNEAGYQRQAYAADPTGGTVTEPASLETFALQQVEASDPIGAEAHTVADDVVGNFLDILGGPFDG